jgi:hypothetical protein
MCRAIFVYACAVLIGCWIPLRCQAQAPTTTTLSISPSSSVASGSLLTVVASVANASSSPVLRGSVIFYDGTRQLGTVQLVATNSGGFTPGTATYRTLSLATGTHSLSAKFTSTSASASSTSPVQSLTVSGPSRTLTALTSASRNTDGSYAFNATVKGVGSASPTGNIVFTDTTAGTTLAAAAVTAVPAGSPTVSTLLSNICSTTVASGDFNGDGIGDLIVGAQNCAATNVATLSSLLGNGDGTFQPPSAIVLPAGFVPASVATGDFNGDGLLDIAVADSSTDRVSVFLGNGNGTFQAPVNITYGNNPNMYVAGEVLMGDFNGDGIPDLLTVIGSESGQYGYVYLGFGNGDGTFQPPVAAQGPFTVNGTQEFDGIESNLTAAVGVADFNSDGKLDFVVLFGGALITYFGNGTTTFKAGYNSSGAPPLASLALGDLNGDGIPDVVVTGVQANSLPASGQSISVSIDRGDGTFSLTQYAETYPSAVVALTDFNGDGKLDVAVASQSGEVCITLGNGDGTLSSSSQCTAVFPQPQALIGGDFSGFGTTDLAVGALGPGAPGVGGVSLVTGTIQSATASLTNVSAPTGHQVDAVYQGDSQFALSTSNSLVLEAQTPVAVQLTAQPLSPYQFFALGVNTTLTASISSVSSQGGPAYTGSVQFYDGGTALGSPVTISGNTATYVTNTLSVGNHSITAVYSGDAIYQSTPSNALILYVQPGGVTLSSQYSGPSSVATGSPITIDILLNPSLPSPVPTGTVGLIYANTSFPVSPFDIIATAPLSGNPPFSISLTVNTPSNPLPAGPAWIQPTYSGDNNWGGSIVAVIPIQIAIQGITGVSLSSSSSSTVASGTAFTLNGQLNLLSPYIVSAYPGGTVTLLDNGTAIATSYVAEPTPVPFAFTLNTASAPLTAGVHSFTLNYSGYTWWLPSTSAPVVITVNPTSTITLSSNIANGSTIFGTGTAAQFVATIGAIGGGPTPTGTVQFYDGTTAIGAPVSLLQGTATFSSSGFAVGSHTVTAVYSGDSTHSSITSSAIAFQIVAQITDTLGVAASAGSPVSSGTSFVVTASISSSVHGAPAPTGTITFKQDGVTVSTVTVSSTQTSFTTNTSAAPLSQGAHSFSASYTGDSVYSASTSGTATASITGDQPTFTFSSNLGSYANVVQGTAVIFTATAGSVNGLAVPTGTVQFYLGSTALGGPVAMAGGVATYSTSTLSSGTNTITAAYSGNSFYDSTTTNGVVAVVTQGSSAMVLTPLSVANVAAGTALTVAGTLNVNSFGPPPTGTVTLLDSGTPLTTLALTGNPPFAPSFQVNTAAQPLAGGTHSFSLQYSGTSQWIPSTSTAQVLTVGDFSLQLSAGSASVSPGGSASETITVADQGGLNATTTFSCTGLPLLATCNFNPSTLAGAGSTTLTVTTASSQAALRRLLGGATTVLAGLLLIGCPKRRRKSIRLPGLLALVSIGSIVGCGGGSNSGSGGGQPGTPAGTYTITVTAATSSPAITHSTTFQLTVQ